MAVLTPLLLMRPATTTRSPAILAPDRAWDTEALAAKAAGVAKRLVDGGILRGDRCIVSLEKGAGFYAGLAGAWMAGAIPVLLDPTVRTELGEAISMTRAASAIIEKRRATTDVGAVVTVFPEDDDTASPREAAGISPDEVVLYLFTSGSTGKPTLVPKTFSQIAVEVDFLTRLFRRPKRVAGLIPWCHIWGMLSSFFVPLRLGGICDLRGGISARGVLSLVADGALDLVAAVPVYYQAMVKLVESGAVRSFRTACCFASSSAPLSGGLRARFEACFGAGITDIYGSTEAGGIAFREKDGPWRAEPHVEIRVDDDGMLAVRSPSVSFETTDGFWQTGDMVQRDQDGFRLLGRGDDIVKIGGRRMALGEIKATIEAMPGVNRAEVLTERVAGTLRLVAFVSRTADAVSSVAVKQHVRAKLADYKVPRTIRFIEGFPMTSSGKLDRQQLIAMMTAKDTK